VANAKPEDIQDLLGGALFKALFKWMEEAGPVYLLPTGAAAAAAARVRLRDCLCACLVHVCVCDSWREGKGLSWRVWPGPAERGNTPQGQAGSVLLLTIAGPLGQAAACQPGPPAADRRGCGLHPAARRPCVFLPGHFRP
jgi:hypothetical protein